MQIAPIAKLFWLYKMNFCSLRGFFSTKTEEFREIFHVAQLASDVNFWQETFRNAVGKFLYVSKPHLLRKICKKSRILDTQPRSSEHENHDSKGVRLKELLSHEAL